MVLKAKVAIELADELAESPTWRASYRCLPPSLLRDTLSSRVCFLCSRVQLESYYNIIG